jgi:hypothetical protein
LTWDLIVNIAEQYWVNPLLLAWVIRNDTQYGKELYSKNNYGNVWNTDELVNQKWPWVEFTTPEFWVEAVAKNLSDRYNAFKAKFADTAEPTIQELLSWKTHFWVKFFWPYMTDKTAYDRIAKIVNDLEPKDEPWQKYDENAIALLSSVTQLNKEWKERKFF